MKSANKRILEETGGDCGSKVNTHFKMPDGEGSDRKVIEPCQHAKLMKDKGITLPLPHSSVDTEHNIYEVGEVKEGEVAITLKRKDFKEGGKYKNIIDEGGRAITNIEGDTLLMNNGKWEYCAKAAEFAVALLNTPAQMVGQGIEVTKLPAFKFVDANKKEKCLITRPESRGVVASVFKRKMDNVDGEFRDISGLTTAIVGPPGIGKSWTLIYALQQILLNKDAMVIYFRQKQKKMFLFVRRENKIYAWQAKGYETEFCDIESAVALIDPQEAKADNRVGLPVGDCMRIYAASNNKNHFVDHSEKDCPGVKRFVGPPTEKELRVMLRYMDLEKSADETEEAAIDNAIKRTKDVNNLPRYILNKKKFDHRKDIMTEALNNLSNVTLKRILNSEGMISNTDNDRETVLMLRPVRPTDYDEIDDTTDKSFLPNEEGYDGDKINYEEKVVIVSSEAVYTKVLEMSRENILSFWGVVYCDQRS